MGEVGGNMVRVRRHLELRRMTLVAIGIRQPIIPVGVTRLARSGRMRACELKPRRAMVERSTVPGHRRVTCLACCREVRGNMARIYGSLIIRAMTCNAISRQCLERIVLMT